METRSKWEDSGYDCNLCGGQVFKRTDEEPFSISSYYQCQTCGAQWSLNNRQIREGDRSKHFKSQKPIFSRPRIRIPNWVSLIVGLGAMFLILRAGAIGVLLVRFLIPVIFIGVVVFVIFRFGKEMEWW